VFVAGISWGGGTALPAALWIPDRFAKVVPMCPAWGLAMIDVWPMLRHAIRLALLPGRRQLLKTSRWFSAVPGEFGGDEDQPLVDDLAFAMKPKRRTKQLGIRVFTDQELASARIPALVLIGEREIIYQDVSAAAERARLIPGARVEIVAGASHGMFYDRPDIVPGMVMEFLL
jgi:pimeloyl-ACP methyl ester carboxylesterase